MFLHNVDLNSEGNPPEEIIIITIVSTSLQRFDKDSETLAEDQGGWRTNSISSVFGQFGALP